MKDRLINTSHIRKYMIYKDMQFLMNALYRSSKDIEFKKIVVANPCNHDSSVKVNRAELKHFSLSKVAKFAKKRLTTCKEYDLSKWETVNEAMRQVQEDFKAYKDKIPNTSDVYEIRSFKKYPLDLSKEASRKRKLKEKSKKKQEFKQRWNKMQWEIL